jgi:serine O-acetyltransferase
MKRLLFLAKYFLKKQIINRLFHKFVKDNDVLKKDITNTYKVRGCSKENLSVKEQFHHLMQYYPTFAYIFFWRINSNYRWKSSFTKDYHCKIFASTQIKGGLVCFHPFATVINAKSIGENFEFRNGLTVGNKFNDNNLLPIIGNHVTVGANVCIIGDIQIGDHVEIGAGAVVVKSIPSNSVVVGNPARIIRTKT